MNRTTALTAMLALAVGFGIGRASAPAPESSLASVTSLRQGLEEADWLERSHRLSSFLQQLGPENLAEATAALEPQLAWITTDELRLFMLAWTRFDPAGALAYALALPAPFHRNAGGAAIYAWAFRDPDGAQAALESVEDEDLREFMASRMVAGWAHAGHERALSEYLSSLPTGPRRFAHVGMLAWELSKRGPEAVTDWAEAAPAAFPRFKAAVFLKASATLASSDPARTALWLAPYLDRPYADGALRVVARSWAVRDPATALAWLTALPPGQDRDAAVSNAFRVWLAHSPSAAERWLRATLPDPAVDAAVAVMVARARRRSLPRSMGWAQAIADPALQSEFLVRLGRVWLQGNPKRAEQWFARNDLSEEVLAAIRAPADPAASDAADAADWAALEADPLPDVELPEAP